tara:strand:+ start:17549 stop:19516 length:1968 start_codon:yes stop_codon:yes gene_type:complete
MMDKLDPTTDGSSMDIVQDNIDQLKAIFPDVFTEGKVDFDLLKSTLGEYLETNDERYSFNWHGKPDAKRISQTPSTGTLRPCEEESKNWDTTQNLFIEGDNLEALKLLQKSYHKQVKMIYIDPPYNTGNEFIYPDNYKDNLDTYLEYTGQKDSEGRKFSGSNSETTGRYHTNWLNMMYPRLKIAKNLLREDGVIFISIGDAESHNIRKTCDEIFGEDNFIVTFSRMMKSGGAKGKFYTPSIDFIHVYARNINLTAPFRTPLTIVQIERFYNKIEESGTRKGQLYGEERLYKASLDPRPNQRYYIECPDGSYVIPPGVTFPTKLGEGEKTLPTSEDGVWKWIHTRYQDEKNKDNIVFKRTKTSALVNESGEQSCWNIYNKLWLKEQQEKGSVPSNFIGSFENRQSSAELKTLGIPFDFAKPVNLLTFLINLACSSDDLILDFFSGSSSTAHAVMQLNAIDNGSRKHIMVQLPERCNEKSEAYKAGYKTIADIGKERIRRAGEKIKANNADKYNIENLDVGFKVFKLDSSNIKAWDANLDNIEASLFDAVDNIKADRSEDDVLYELLLKYGIDLTVPIEQRQIAGKAVYSIGFGALIICLADDITLDVVDGIGKLKEELAPELTHVVFKDSGLKDDVVKTNAIQILKRYDINDVKTL